MTAGKITDNNNLRRFEPLDCCDEYDMMLFLLPIAMNIMMIHTDEHGDGLCF